MELHRKNRHRSPWELTGKYNLPTNFSFMMFNFHYSHLGQLKSCQSPLCLNAQPKKLGWLRIKENYIFVPVKRCVYVLFQTYKLVLCISWRGEPTVFWTWAHLDTREGQVLHFERM